MVRAIVVAVLLVAACKKDKPKICVQVDECCKSLGGDKPLMSGTPVDDALASACTGTNGVSKNQCADYATKIREAFGKAQQDERLGGAQAPKVTPACRDMDPYAD